MAQATQLAILNSLCKRLSLDSTNFSGELEKCDVKSVCSSILKTSGSSLLSSEEVLKWIAFADDFPVESKASLEALNRLNDELATKSVVLGKGFKISELDILVFAAVHPLVITLAKSDAQKLPHVLRWMDYVQSKEELDLTESFARLSLEKASFEPPVALPASKANVEGNANATDTVKASKIDSSVKNVDKSVLNDGDKTAKKTSKKTDAPTFTAAPGVAPGSGMGPSFYPNTSAPGPTFDTSAGASGSGFTDYSDAEGWRRFFSQQIGYMTQLVGGLCAHQESFNRRFDAFETRSYSYEAYQRQWNEEQQDRLQRLLALQQQHYDYARAQADYARAPSVEDDGVGFVVAPTSETASWSDEETGSGSDDDDASKTIENSKPASR